MTDDKLTEVIGAKKPIYKGKILNVQEWTVTLPNGAEAMREVALHIGASAVIPVDKEGYTYFVKQFRTPFERVFLEVPAGKLDYAGENRLEAAKRELREETGFTAEKWTHLIDLSTTPGFSNEVISLYLAEELTLGETDPDEDEFIDLVKLKFEDAVKLVTEGKITDAKTAVCVLLADQHMH
ncbi:MAG: NUDIX hydrolase [Clostridia bacterium]|nr:NUDIX hydrolase [Clostridia bacterium]